MAAKNKSSQGVFGNLASWRLCSKLMRADGRDRPSSSYSYGCITRDLEMRNRQNNNNPNDQMAAKGARKWGVCGHTFHNISCTFGHFSCEIGGCFFGINKHDRHPARSQNDRSERGRHHTKGTRYVVNSLAALLGASAAIWSQTVTTSGGAGRLDANGGQMKRNKSDFTYISCTFGMMPAAFGPALPATAISQLASQQIRRNILRFRTRSARRYTKCG